MALRPTSPSAFPRGRVPTVFAFPSEVFQHDGTIQITKRDGTVVDVTEYVMNAVAISAKSIRDGLSTMNFTINNPNGKWVDNMTGELVFQGGETVKADFGYSGNQTRQFKGKLNAPKVSLKGMQHLIEFSAITAPEVGDRRIKINVDGSIVQAVKDIIDTYLPSVLTYSNFNANLGAVTKSVKATYDGTILSILSDLFQRGGFHGCVDFDPGDTGKHDLRGHIEGSVETDNIIIAFSQNLQEINGYGIEDDQVSNTIKINGNTVGGGRLLHTAVNEGHRSQFWRRDKEISDTKIQTRDELIERAALESARLGNPPKTGTFRIIGEPRLVCGEAVHITSPDDGINEKASVAGYQHRWDHKFESTVHVERRERSTHSLIQDRIIVDEQAQEFDNPNDAEYSLNFSFDPADDLINQQSNIIRSNGVIFLVDGQSQGEVLSKLITLPTAVSRFDVFLENPVQLEKSKVFVSVDKGVSFQDASLSTRALQALSSATKTVQLKIQLNSDGGANPNPSLGGAVFHFKE